MGFEEKPPQEQLSEEDELYVVYVRPDLKFLSL